MTTGLLTTNYNTWHLSEQCIQHCLDFADDNIEEFVVVDDCSDEIFSNQFKNVNLICNPKNYGLVKSLNIGLTALNTDLVILFDSDAWPLENYIKKTKDYFQNNPKVGIAAYRTEKVQGEISPAFEAEPDFFSVLLGQKLHKYYQQIFNRNPKRITVYTCAMVLRNEVLKEIGGFDEKYDWLELDHDICMRAMRSGWEVGVIPVRAFHKGSGTPQLVSKRVIRFYQNRIKLLKKFKKYPAPLLLNGLIVMRLSFEYMLINIFGRIKYSDSIRKDKSHSRSTLISCFLKGQI